MHGTITNGPPAWETAGNGQWAAMSTTSWISTDDVTLTWSAYPPRSPDPGFDALRARFAAAELDYARIGATRRLAIDSRPRPPRHQAGERAPVPHARMRIPGGRQSYGRVRCDRRRKVWRAERSKGVKR